MGHLQGIRHKLTTSTAVLATAVLLVGGGVAVAQNAALTADADEDAVTEDGLEELDDPVDDGTDGAPGDVDDPDGGDGDPSEGGHGDEDGNGDDDAADPDADSGDDADLEDGEESDLDGELVEGDEPEEVEEPEELPELAVGGSACAASTGEVTAADGQREDRRSDTAKRVHHALTGTPDLRPGDPNFGPCISERARQGKLGPLVSRAARGDDGWDEDLTPLPKGKPSDPDEDGTGGEVDAATEGAPSAGEAKRGRPDHAGPKGDAGPKNGASQQRGRPDHAGPPAHAGPKSGAGESGRPGGDPKPGRGGGRG